jgi:hypothetical protein
MRCQEPVPFASLPLILSALIGIWLVTACTAGQAPGNAPTLVASERGACPEGQRTGPKKLIYYGWGIPETQYVRDHWREMEQMPFDGTGINVAVDRKAWLGGVTAINNRLGWRVVGRTTFRIEDFADTIADLRAAGWQRFTDNFLPVYIPIAEAADLNWFDEERWRIVVNNFGVVAKIAAEGGAKGLILDPEQGTTVKPFSYPSQRQQVNRPFAEYAQMARLRGRQVMAAITTSLPDPVILSLLGYTLTQYGLRPGDPVPEAPYGLLPAFYDGLLEAMPPRACLIDGYEFAYGYKQRRQFLEGYRKIHETAITLSAVPRLYRAHVRAGFGLWLDGGRRPDYFSPEELRRALSDALDISDGYVWLYSQGPKFFPPSGIEASYLNAIAAGRATKTP